MKKQKIKFTGPICTTEGRITIDQTEPSGATFRGSCNVCGWRCRRLRMSKGEARSDITRHASDCHRPAKWSRKLVTV